jgi:cation:H+ antiporter
VWAWIEFAAAAAAILLASDKLSRGADIVAEKLGVGRGFIGVVLLGAVTSMPEMITTVSSITVVGSADLAVGNVFGSNLFNVLIIAVMDFGRRERSIESGNILAAILSILVATVAITGLLFGEVAGGFWRISWFSVAILIVYASAIRSIYAHDQSQQVDGMEDPFRARYSEEEIGKAVLTTVLSATVIVLAGVVAATAVGVIAEQHHLGETFAGSFFLAFATSLPELVVCISAVRMGSSAMAAGNVFGSNLFNLAILPVADLFTPEPLFAGVTTRPHLLLAVGGIAVSSLAVAGFVLGKRRRKLGRLGWDSILIIACYVGVIWSTYRMG